MQQRARSGLQCVQVVREHHEELVLSLSFPRRPMQRPLQKPRQLLMVGSVPGQAWVARRW